MIKKMLTKLATKLAKGELDKRGGLEKITDISLGESIYFYTRWHYLIINNLLCSNMDELWKQAEFVNENLIALIDVYKKSFQNKDKLNEILSRHFSWKASMYKDLIQRLGEEQIKWSQRRIYEVLDDSEKANVIKMAKCDIKNILNAMVPAKTEILLHRNVGIGDELDFYNIGDIIEFNIISSTFIDPGSYYNRGYNKKCRKYELTVPKSRLLLELDSFNEVIRNEAGEILLPPMKCKVKNIRFRESPTANGDWDIIELEYTDDLIDETLYKIAGLKT